MIYVFVLRPGNRRHCEKWRRLRPSPTTTGREARSCYAAVCGTAEISKS